MHSCWHSSWIRAATAGVFGALLLAAPQQAETFKYRFDADKELADFEVVAGSWKVASGDLWCTSKGAREELRWRRALTANGSASVQLVGAGRVALVLTGGAQETSVRIDRGDARVVVEVGGTNVLERPFEVAAATPIALAIAWSATRIEVKVGDDEPLTIARAAGAAPFAKLALLSLKSQPRLDDFVITRDAAAPADPGAADPDAPPLTEDLKLAIERATALADASPDAAFELLVKELPKPAAGGAPKLPDPALVLLQRLALARAGLRTKPPLKERIADATLAANDGSATIVLPLRSGWSAKAPEVRRKESVIFAVKCDSPALEVELFRYDQQLQYGFGRNPKLVLTTGGGGPTLGHAKADDEKDRHEKSEFVHPFDKSRVALAGGTAYEYELAWPDPDDPARTRAMRELFVLHRGDTWRVTITGPKVDLELAAADLDWLLANLELLRE